VKGNDDDDDDGDDDEKIGYTNINSFSVL